MFTTLLSNNFSKFPAGALTSKAYAYTSRNWELESFSSLDIFDAFGSSINVGLRGSTPMRILPKVNEKLNEEWITDKVRLSYEGYSRQRLTSPLVKVNNLLIPCSWSSAFEIFSKKLLEYNVLTTISGRLLDIESLLALKDFSATLGFKWRSNSSGLVLDSNLREFYLCFLNLTNFDSIDLLVLVGCDLKVESPLLNLYVRRLVRSGSLVVESFGYTASNSNFHSIGTSVGEFVKFVEGRHSLSIKFARSVNPFVLVGYAFLKYLNFSFSVLLNVLGRIAILHPFSGYLNSSEVAFSTHFTEFKNYRTPTKGVLFLAGVDEVLKPTAQTNTDCFVVYQGHNGALGASMADLVFPSTIFLEKDGSFINNFGLQQSSPYMLTPPTQVRTDWRIFDALLCYCTKKTQFQISSTRIEDFIFFKHQVSLKSFTLATTFNFDFCSFGLLNSGQLQSYIFDYYRTDAITQSSKTLLLASKNRFQNYTNFLL